MSSFFCSKCEKEIVDSPVGYVTFCEHYPPPDEKKDKCVEDIKQVFNKMGIKLD